MPTTVRAAYDIPAGPPAIPRSQANSACYQQEHGLRAALGRRAITVI
jgi:hypothetical protein